MNIDNKNLMCEKSQSESSQVQFRLAEMRAAPFPSVMELVETQIDFDCFAEVDKAQAKEIALIIAEIFKLPPNTAVRIVGNDLPAEMVAEIYEKIEHEHVLQVLENLKKPTYEIKRTKTYIRTALYNSVFELNGRLNNQLFSTMPWLAQK